MIKKTVIYIDMDHTFCDFATHRDVWQNFAKTEIENTYPWSMRGFFESLPVMPGAIEFWNKWAEECDLYFLTRPSLLNRHSYTEKANWIFKHLGQNGIERLIMSPRKDLLIGDILIDDYGGNGQSEFIGEWWQFGLGKYKNWESCSDELEEICWHRRHN